ncbi:hypothetical protein CFELI_03755 [Corynebacterium felinum]|uniref:Uncharacterized protein n=2 Tax=Corynebacteriaceae TaxID=1653 RepID=A0ABU2B9U0_9CORY|nr:hypothetical protein [Corynebacterium felinum]WJY94384.1 hypothetical protein CFELI_03755 [Corynebacterium felinum]
MVKQPIFHDVNRRSVAASFVEEDGKNVLVLELLDEEGNPIERLLTLNRFDAKQLSAACDRYLHQQISIDYSYVNSLLSTKDHEDLGYSAIDE